MEAKLSKKNQIVIPKECREILDLHSGDKILFIPKGNVLLLVKPEASPSRALKGSYKTGDLAKKVKKDRETW